MLRHDEINALKGIIQRGGETILHPGIKIERREVGLPVTTDRRVLASEAESPVIFNPPSSIIGTPFDQACLNGVRESRSIIFPEKEIYEICDARIIGWNAAIDGKGVLYHPNVHAGLQKHEDFVSGHRSEFAGYICRDVGATLEIYFGSKEDRIYFPKTSIFFPYIEQGNYGSFLFRGLPAMLFAAAQKFSADRIIVPERTPWVMEVLAMLGFANAPVFGVREIAGDNFEHLLMVTVPDKEGLLDERTLDRVQQLKRHLSAEEGSRRIYVSRRLSYLARPHYRVLRNEAKLESLAAAAGFDVVYPEAFNFREQLQCFCRANRIVGPSGSGMLNAIFSAANSQLVDMESYHTTVRQHAKIYSSTKKDYSFLFGELCEGDRGAAFSPWHVSESLFRQALERMI